MRHSLLTLLIASATLSAALPPPLTSFLLVTTTQLDPSANSSDLKAVSATSLFDPFNQPALLLRLTGPGYTSLPTFTLTSGTLSTLARAPFGGGQHVYNSTLVAAGQELQFLASVQPAGNLALDDGYLLTVGGEREGWMVCVGALENEVLVWRGNGTGCRGCYVHAVRGAPY